MLLHIQLLQHSWNNIIKSRANIITIFLFILRALEKWHTALFLSCECASGVQCCCERVESTQNRVLYTSYFYCPVATATVTASEAVWHFYRTIHHLDTCFFQQNFYDYSSWNVCVCAFTAIFYYALLLFRLFWCTNVSKYFDDNAIYSLESIVLCVRFGSTKCCSKNKQR